MTARILVTDGEQRAALAVTRSLGRAGYHVGVVAAAERSLAGVSRWAAWRAAVPAAADDPERFAEAIIGLVRRERIDVVVPITEASLLALLPRRGDLAPTVVPFADADTFSAISDKGRVLAEAARLGIAVPRAVRVESPADGRLERLPPLDYPVVIKPERSVRVSGGSMAKLTVVHASNPQELEAALEELPPEAFPLQIQQRIVGPGIGLFFLIWDGRVVARFAHRRLREKPPSGGVSVYSESVPIDQPLAAQAERLLAAFRWHGVAMVEFKRDAATGTPYLMEINGRFWGSLELAIMAGIDFPKLLVELALGHNPAPPAEYRIGARCRWWWGDIDQLVTRFRRSAADLHLPPGTPGVAAMLWRVLIPGITRGRNEVFRLSDPRPGLLETVRWFTGLL